MALEGQMDFIQGRWVHAHGFLSGFLLKDPLTRIAHRNLAFDGACNDRQLAKNWDVSLGRFRL